MEGHRHLRRLGRGATHLRRPGLGLVVGYRGVAVEGAGETPRLLRGELQLTGLLGREQLGLDAEIDELVDLRSVHGLEPAGLADQTLARAGEVDAEVGE